MIIDSKSEAKDSRKDQANAFRKERGYTGGFVVFFEGEVSGWSLDFPRSEAYVPGCIAVDDSGSEWVSMGGNDQDGAESWEVSRG